MQTDRFKLTNSKMSDRLEFKLMKAKSRRFERKLINVKSK